MKKVLALVLTVVLALTTLTTTAFAATDSPEKLKGVITGVSAKDPDGKDVEVVLDDPTDKLSDYDNALAELKKTEGNDLKIVDHKRLRLKGDGTPKYPITVTLKIPGVKSTSKGYILFNNNGTIEKLAVTMGDGTVTANFNALGNFVFVTDSQTIKDIESPKTGDTATPIVLAILLASIGIAIVSVKKITA